MDEEIIDDIALAFAERLGSTETRDTHYGTILEDIIAMACVINDHAPTYDLRYFYRNAGFPEPYPQHIMK